MPRPKASEQEIAEAIREGLSQTEILQRFNMTLSQNTSNRIRRIAKSHDLSIRPAEKSRPTKDEQTATKALEEFLRPHARRHLSIENGTVLIGSDAHYWPGIVSTAHRAFVRFCADLKPRAVIMNGDSLDGASISRWPRIGWDNRPTVLQELEAVKERKAEIEVAASTRELYWPCGNHDARFETFLASRVPEFQGVDGFRLKDHFPLWAPCWSVWINNDVVVKHRYKGGLHATHNNALWGGKSMVTGHLHSQKVTPLSDYNGTRWGVDCGTLAQPHGAQFEDYTEDNPVNWRSGFTVLTFWNGHLLDPELARVVDEEAGLVSFRGQVIHV